MGRITIYCRFQRVICLKIVLILGVANEKTDEKESMVLMGWYELCNYIYIYILCRTCFLNRVQSICLFKFLSCFSPRSSVHKQCYQNDIYRVKTYVQYAMSCTNSINKNVYDDKKIYDFSQTVF